MKLFNQYPISQDTPDFNNEKLNITKLIEYELYCDDTGNMNALKDCYSQDSRIRLSWFEGNVNDYVNQKEDLRINLKHKIFNTLVWLNGNKAIAETQCMILEDPVIDGTGYHYTGFVRYLYRVQKEADIWKLRSCDCIYEKDRLDPELSLQDTDRKYRDSYKYLTILSEKRGIPCNERLPGDDRPLITKEIYVDATNWLNQDRFLPRLRPLTGIDYKTRMQRVSYLEQHDAERFTGNEPLSVKEVYDELLDDFKNVSEKYSEKRVIVTGVVSDIGPDVWGVPSLELSDTAEGRCYALTVFFDEKIYDEVKVGDRVTILGNILNIREPYGCVIKKCELIKVE